MDTGPALVITGLAVMANAFFVASEFAIVKIRSRLIRGRRRRAQASPRRCGEDVVPRDRIELSTHGFSVHCSTN
jgi:hypothetical protein